MSVLRCTAISLAAGFVLAASLPLHAQERGDSLRFIQQQRLIEDKLADERMELAPASELLDVQWGGWIDYYLFHYDDGVQSSRKLQRPGFAFWTRLSFDDNAHEIFARVRMRYTHFDAGDEIDDQKDWWGPNFDRAWYGIDVGRAFRLTEPDDPFQLRLRLGRQLAFFGTGYALDIPLDAVTVDTQLYDWKITGLFGRTLGSWPNVDRSEPVDSHSDRLFYGVQFQYEGWDNHEPFLYAIWNNDRTDERPKDLFQNYSYDTFYAGFGARGQLAPQLLYWAEGVWEAGRSYGDGAIFEQDFVQAWGWDLGLEWMIEHPTRPRLALEYMFASGDPDRYFSPTSARGGNRGDREDNSFVAFGYRDTGIAAGFIPSNLHIWRAGASFVPLPEEALFRDLELGTNWFLYHKHRTGGAISDPTADVRSGYVGWEMDYFLNWRLASDIAWTTRWGVFFPGKAYRDRGARHFIFTGLTWSF